MTLRCCKSFINLPQCSSCGQCDNPLVRSCNLLDSNVYRSAHSDLKDLGHNCTGQAGASQCTVIRTLMWCPQPSHSSGGNNLIKASRPKWALFLSRSTPTHKPLQFCVNATIYFSEENEPLVCKPSSFCILQASAVVVTQFNWLPQPEEQKKKSQSYWSSVHGFIIDV